MPRKSTTAQAPTTPTPSETPAPSALLHCELHGQTVEMVIARWDQVPGLSRERATDLTACGCCTGPALYPGVSAMTLSEVGGIHPLCSRCSPKADEETDSGTVLGGRK